MKDTTKHRSELAREVAPAGMAAVLLILSTGCTQPKTSAAVERWGAPIELRCEYGENPLGIDVRSPRLSWEVNDARRGAVQTAYHIVVSTDPSFADADAVVWDTGKVASDRSIHVPYAGEPLESGRRYHWKVRTWDIQDKATAWAMPAWWEMGLLRPEDWSATWISSPEDLVPEPEMTWGQWIWDAQAQGENTTAYFRRTFEIDPTDPVVRGHIRITVDDEQVLFVNGREIGESGIWNVVNTYDITDRLVPGRNVIAAIGRNGPGAFGLIAAVRIDLESGRAIELPSGGSWRTLDRRVTDWNTIDFDDSQWPQALVVADYGDEPWNELDTERAGPRTSTLLRRSFTLDGEVVRARAYASGLGLYELRLNGRKVGDDIFTPGWTHYPRRVQYQTYDVTDLLRQGENVVGAILGNGWWSGGLGWASEASYNEGQELRFILQLDIEYDDGRRTSVVSDPTWRAHASPITRDSFYHGETYDARLEQRQWDEPGFTGDGWRAVTYADEPARLVAQNSPTIQVTEELRPMNITQPDSGVYIVDFGQNASGYVQIRVRGKAGETVRLRFGEELDPDGRLYRDNYRSAEATDYYICRGDGVEIWEPRFTYRGFRYCEITDWPQADPENPQPPSKDDLVFKVVHNALPIAGEFASSNWLLDRVKRNTLWGLRSNLHSVPTDCPQRDERLGWMGDAQAFAPASCYLMDMAGFYAKWMRDIRDSQAEDGSVTDVAPVIVVHGPAKPGWGDAVTIVPWTVYQYYGDERIIEENYDAMRAWVEYMRSKSENDLYETPGYGDWVAPVPTRPEPIGSAYYYYSTKLLSKMAEVIGRDDDAFTYAELASRIAEAFNARHLDMSTYDYWDGTQTANILPLWFGITPPEHQSAVFRNLVRDIQERGYRLSTGFLGTAYLMPLLTRMGAHDVAWELAVQTRQPSWGYMVTHGATTIWERWDTDKHGPAMNSRNHFCFGMVVEWFYGELAGLRPDPEAPGFKRTIVRPRPIGDLDHAAARYRTPYGEVVSSWERTDHSLTLFVRLPANTSGRVYVPTPGGRNVTIRESGTVVFRNGRATGRVPGVTFIRMEEDSAVFEVGAGEYTFRVWSE